MNISYPILQYSQNGTAFISLILPLSVVDSISRVLVYGIDEDGYQRLPNSAHYNKIKKYAESHPSNFILPTSVILGGNLEIVNKMISKKNGQDFINIPVDKKIFRVVDGQHRISGLKEAAKSNPNINSFQLNVIIVLSKETQRSKELQIFSDINSRSKRINVDLAELAKYDYRIKENNVPEEEINRHIAIKTAYFIKEYKPQNGTSVNVWQNAIKFDIHSEITLGIIGITIFSESIKQIIDRYIVDHSYVVDGVKLSGKPLIEYCNKASINIGTFILKVWNDVIRVKWQGAFKEDVVQNDEGELVKTFYNKDYYIQKGLGIKSLNPIIGEIVKEKGIDEDSFKQVAKVIFNSKVKIDDWKNGGPFSGFNSESGFSKIKQMITNTLPIPNPAK